MRWSLSFDALVQDTRYALRTIRRAREFSAIAVASSALGIGTCAVIFAVLNFALFKPLPVAGPDPTDAPSELDRQTGEFGNEPLLPPHPPRPWYARRRPTASRADRFPPARLRYIIPGQVAKPERHWGSLCTRTTLRS